MQAPERSVLHVLPHPGGGGETYVDLLEEMPGYRFARVYLAPGPRATPALARGLLEAARNTRRHDLLHVHGDAAAALCLPLLATRPSVVTLHGLNLVRRLGGARRRAAALALRAVLRAADRTICVSQAEREELLRIAGQAATERALVIRNGVRVPPALTANERAVARRELGIAEDEVVGIWVGALGEHKGPLAAVRAARKAGVGLLVVGEGPLRTEVEREAGDRVRVLGQRADVPRLLGAADLFVLTSQREGLSVSLLEAMAAGLPAVVTDLPENVEAVGGAGITVPCEDDDALVAALSRLAADDNERAELGKLARTRILEDFEADRMLGQTAALYDEVGVRQVRQKTKRPQP